MFRWCRQPMSDTLNTPNKGLWKLLPNYDLKWNLYIYSSKQKKYVLIKDGLRSKGQAEKLIKHFEQGEFYCDGSLIDKNL